MITQNLHMHSTWDDGKSTIEEMILASRAAGLTSVGLSVHAPLPFDSCWVCPQERLSGYIAEVRRMQEKHAGEIRVYLGVEWDVLSRIDLEPYDYAIGSAHMLPVKQADGTEAFPSVDESAEATEKMLREHFDGDADAAAVRYFAELEKVALEPRAQIVGHFDLLTKFDEQRHFFDDSSPAYCAAAQKALEKLVRAGKIFEVNTGAISRGYRTSPYPAKKWLCLLREMGGRVTVSSDAHHVSGVACCFEEAERLIRTCGFREIWTLGDGGFAPCSL